MACFLVPTTEAIVTTIVQKVVRKSEGSVKTKEGEIKFSDKLGWLNGMLWGGSGLLAFEHIWHGEVVPFFPFLTSTSNPADVAKMFHEMAISGSAMAGLVTLAWAGLVLATNKIAKLDVPEELKVGET